MFIGFYGNLLEKPPVQRWEKTVNNLASARFWGEHHPRKISEKIKFQESNQRICHV